MSHYSLTGRAESRGDTDSDVSTTANIVTGPSKPGTCPEHPLCLVQPCRRLWCPNRVHLNLTAPQADDLYELVTSRAAAGKSLVLTSNRSPVDWYPLFPNPVVAESLLDRLINTSHQVFMNGPSYRPHQRPGARTTTASPKAAATRTAT